MRAAGSSSQVAALNATKRQALISSLYFHHISPLTEMPIYLFAMLSATYRDTLASHPTVVLTITVLICLCFYADNENL